MLKAFIDFDRCLKCEKCIAAVVCPTKAIFRIDPDGPAIVEQSACYGCRDCVEKCSGKAVTIKEEWEKIRLRSVKYKMLKRRIDR